MKKILKFGLVLVAALTTTNGHAGTVDFTGDVKNEQRRMVTFAINTIDKLNLSIYDADEKLIHSEIVNSKKDFNRKYDLNALPEGTYFLQTESDSKISTYEISVVGATASLSADAISEVYKPTFYNKDGLVWVSLLNPDESAVTIKIYDNENNEVYNSGLLLGKNVTKIFDVNNFQNDAYTIVVTDNQEEFINTFSNK